MAAKQITDATFNADVLQSNIPVLVDFWAPWCSPCRALAPVIDELAAQYTGKVSIVKINVDENPSSPATYGIRAIPTLILFKNGEAVETLTGASSKTHLIEFLDGKAVS